MKKFLKWAGSIVGVLIVVGFLSFLYLIPPFTLVPPETFVKQTADAAPPVDAISDPAERALAERGRYIVTVADCSGCHTPVGDQGPIWDEYLAGGGKTTSAGNGTFISRNLTPEKETGLARRSDEQVKRVLRSGLLPEGRIAYHDDMPWPVYANWTEEDRHAVLVYLRHIKPVWHKIPPDKPEERAVDDPAAVQMYPGHDWGEHKANGK
jgi:hypothetical protein